MIRPKIAIHTDIIAEYLIHHGTHPPALRIAMMKFFCYTTVFNAIELFAQACNERERDAVAAAMGAMKILGLNAKQAISYGSWFAANAKVKPLSMLVAGICLESKLPILTSDAGAFRGIKGLRVIRASALNEDSAAEQILVEGITR